MTSACRAANEARRRGFGVRFGIEVAERQHDRVDDAATRAPCRATTLAAVRPRRSRRPQAAGGRRPPRSAAACGSTCRWNHSRYTDCTRRVGNVIAPSAADLVDERRRRERGKVSSSTVLRPLVQRRARADRPLALDGLVGEQRDVLGHRVHPQTGMQLSGRHTRPVPARCGSIRCTRRRRPVQQLGRVGREPLEQRRRRRTGADDRHLEWLARATAASADVCRQSTPTEWSSPRWSRSVGPS